MKVLVIQQKMIGDVLTSSILFEALRQKYPQAELHYMLYKHTFPVVQNNPHIDKFIFFDPEKDSALNRMANLAKSLRKQGYYIVVDVYSKIGTAFLAYLSGAEIRVSQDKWYTRSLYTHTLKPKEKLQTNAGFAVENRMQLLRVIDESFPVEIRPKIYLSDEEKAAAKQQLESGGVSLEQPLIMCGILGSSEDKTYPAVYMAETLDFIVDRTGAQILLNYIPYQESQVQEILRHCKPETSRSVFSDLTPNSLRNFLAITSFCDALVGNEGGAVNMAKALDLPTFAIFSPQINKNSWAIYDEGRKNVSVHISDYLEEETPGEQLKKDAEYYYQKFRPDLFLESLRHFLERLDK